ncbi:MAG: DUF262 domain-containing HNH endonuclease family protein [Brevinematales bacterium]|nr:DUF262 domain-containing HNH endonuclease family protein [Brevinematales bacterium]
MRTINARPESISDLLDRKKYNIDYFQREYKWKKEHVIKLLEDITEEFYNNFNKNHKRSDVKNYNDYYMGSIILYEGEEGTYYIIDGQQRLTTFTLLLIYLDKKQKYYLKSSQLKEEDVVRLDDMIYSSKFGSRSFNLQIPEREAVLRYLYDTPDEDIDKEKYEKDPSSNLVERYLDIAEFFESTYDKNDNSDDEQIIHPTILPFFLDWLAEKVIFVKIETRNSQDAYFLFETVNDRGLKITQSEILKGYLISKIPWQSRRDAEEADKKWKNTIHLLENEDIKEDEFFRAWFRSKYANNMEDYQKIGGPFHKWFYDNESRIKPNDHHSLIDKDLPFFTKLYLKIHKSFDEYIEGLEGNFYISKISYVRSIFYTLLFSPIKMDDSKYEIDKKMALVSFYIEISFVLRFINYYSTNQEAMLYDFFKTVLDIRDRSLEDVCEILRSKSLELYKKTSRYGKSSMIDGFDDFVFSKEGYKKKVRFLLARITSFIEKESGMPDRFYDYSASSNKYQIEHIIPNNYDKYKNMFEDLVTFNYYRSKMGNLILIPKGKNQSYGNMEYEEKRKHYLKENLLAQSLHEDAYKHNPGFVRFIKQSNLNFKPYEVFDKKAIEERSILYKEILKRIYDPENFYKILKD